MNDRQKLVCVSKYKENCFVLTSFRQRDAEETHGQFLIKPAVSFLYDAGDFAAEWEVQYGPIQVWNRCEEDSPNAKEHYYYDYDNAPPGNWSQLAVEDNQLPEAAAIGDYDYIFHILKAWAKD